MRAYVCYNVLSHHAIVNDAGLEGGSPLCLGVERSLPPVLFRGSGGQGGTLVRDPCGVVSLLRRLVWEDKGGGVMTSSPRLSWSVLWGRLYMLPLTSACDLRGFKVSMLSLVWAASVHLGNQ